MLPEPSPRNSQSSLSRSWILTGREIVKESSLTCESDGPRVPHDGNSHAGHGCSAAVSRTFFRGIKTKLVQIGPHPLVLIQYAGHHIGARPRSRRLRRNYVGLVGG